MNQDLKRRVKTLRILEENINVNIYDLVLGNSFLAMTPKAQTKEYKRN